MITAEHGMNNQVDDHEFYDDWEFYNDWNNKMKWMPPKPKFIKASYSILFPNHGIGGSGDIILSGDFDSWYDREIKPLFENANEVVSHKNWGGWYEGCGPEENPSKRALLIKIEPITEENAESILQELHDCWEMTQKLPSYQEFNLKKDPSNEKGLYESKFLSVLRKTKSLLERKGKLK